MKTGKIKFYHTEKFYGFCVDECGDDFFFHKSDVENPEDLAQGRTLEFETEQGPKGMKAIEAKVVPF